MGLPPRPLGAPRRLQTRQARQNRRERHGHHRRGRRGTQVGSRRAPRSTSRTAARVLGSGYYERMPGGGKSIFGAGGGAELEELRVYVALGDSDIAKKYVPNMFQWGRASSRRFERTTRETPRGGTTPRSRRAGGRGGFPWQRFPGEGQRRGGGFEFPWSTRSSRRDAIYDDDRRVVHSFPSSRLLVLVLFGSRGASLGARRLGGRLISPRRVRTRV